MTPFFQIQYFGENVCNFNPNVFCFSYYVLRNLKTAQATERQQAKQAHSREHHSPRHS